MRTSEQLFVRDFKMMMNERRAASPNFRPAKLPLPPLPGIMQEEPKNKLLGVRGITEPYFEKLNETRVVLHPKRVVYKRQVNSDGTFSKDNEGKFVYKEIKVPADSVAVYSTLSIALKNTEEVNGVKRKRKITPGFMYVDFKETSVGREYMYLIPKEYLSILNLCALVLTPNKRRVYYRGCKVALQNGHYVYIYVVPYTYRDSQDARIIGIKHSAHFNKEMKLLLNTWVAHHVLFDLGVTALVEQVGGNNNIGIFDFTGPLMEEEFEVWGKPLIQSEAEEYEELNKPVFEKGGNKGAGKLD